MNLYRSVLAFVLCVATATTPYLLPAAGVAAVAMTAACSTTQIITDITKFSPVLVDILQIITAADGTNTTGLQAKVAQDTTDAQTLVQAYLNAGSVGTWNDMNAALSVLSADASTVFQMANVVNPSSQAKVNLIVASAQTAFAIIESLLPSAPASAQPAVRHFSAHAPVSPLTLGDWTTGWNKLMTSKSGDPKLDAITPKMQIHVHGWFVRHATFRPGQ
jgi:hypothetical protein